MISRPYRFHGQNALRYLYSKGSVVRSSSMALKYVRGNRTARCRVAVVVSKKVSKSAVVRNRIRRRIYEAVRLRIGGQSPAFDLAFMVYDARLATDSPEVLQETVDTLLKKASFISNARPRAIVDKKE